MTQTEAEAIAREIRNRCLHSSWGDLVAFWQGVVKDLGSAYCVAAQGAEPRPVVRDRLESALSQLVGAGRVARWCSEGPWALDAASGD